VAEEIDFSEFIDVFLQEAFEQIEKLDDGLLRLEKDPEDTDILNEIFRAAHTLKGSSATMEFFHIRDLTHAAENLLDALRRAGADARRSAVDSLLATTSVLHTLIENVKNGDTTGAGHEDEVAAVRAQLAAAMPGAEPADEAAATASSSAVSAAPSGPGTQFVVTFSERCQMPSVRAFMATQTLEQGGSVLWTNPSSEAIESIGISDTFTIGVELDEGVDPAALAEKVASIPEVGGCTVQECAVQESSPAAASQAATQPEAASASRARKPERAESSPSSDGMQTVRVAVDRLDNLVNLIGELVVDRTGLVMVENALSQCYGADQSVQSLGSIAAHIERVVGDLHDEIMKMRMLPVGQVFRRFPRMVRDLASQLGKKIDLVLEGEQTGLDRSILEDIVDPLTHLLRNSIDHGIELPEERLAAGKPETGRVVLSARHEEGHVVIEIEDDGHGIDVARLKEASMSKGAVTKEAAAKMDDREALNLLFQSGVSTARKVTDISGRGVGMDVVKNNIEKLHGHVEVDSVPGKGSRFTVRLPLTLAIVQSLVVRCGERLFALPLSSVVSATIETADRIHTIQGVPCVVIRNRTLPLLSTAEIFDGEDMRARDGDALVVIVQSRGQQAAFAVEELIGKMDIVVKSLGAYLGSVPGLSGAAILGDGHLALIVDIGSMLDLVRNRRGRRAA